MFETPKVASVFGNITFFPYTFCRYLAAIHYFLSLFPVFTLSTNFPIIAITLRNNLKSLFLTEGKI